MTMIMIRTRSLSKEYKLGQIGGTTLREELQRSHAKLHHREDPTKKIGAKNYNKGETFMALSDVSFDVLQGERLGVIGHNGAGKTTLLRLLSRITAPTEGSFSLNGRVASILGVGVGFNGELTGRENIYMNGAILGMTKKEIDAKVEDIIDFSECREFIDTPIKRYSSGMNVKLAFSVSAHLEAEILIMDEVLAVGDMAFQKKCLDKMNEISRSKNKTILYVSHNMDTIRELCNRTIVIDHGKKVFDGDVEDGIAIYMHNNRQTGCEFALDDCHEIALHQKYLSMNRTELLNSDDGKYIRGAALSFYLYMSTMTPITNLRFRFEIASQNNEVIGSALTPEELRVEQNREYQLKIDIDTKNLAPGKYWIKAVAFECSSWKAFDIVSPALTFQIMQNRRTYPLWNSPRWGKVAFDDVRLSAIERKG